MARPLKNGWDYYPQDVSEFTNDKMLYLREKHGHAACYFYLALKSDLFKVGACYLWNEDIAISFCARHGFKLDDCQTWLLTCLTRGLFNQIVFDETGCITSKDIQREVVAMARTSKRRLVEIPENVLLLQPEAFQEVNITLTPALFKGRGKEREREIDIEREIESIYRKDSEETQKISEITTINSKKSGNNFSVTSLIQYGKFLRMQKCEMDKILAEFGDTLVAQELPEADEWIALQDSPNARKYRKPSFNHYLFFRQTWLKNKTVRAPSKSSNANRVDRIMNLVEKVKKEEDEKRRTGTSPSGS